MRGSSDDDMGNDDGDDEDDANDDNDEDVWLNAYILFYPINHSSATCNLQASLHFLLSNIW